MGQIEVSVEIIEEEIPKPVLREELGKLLGESVMSDCFIALIVSTLKQFLLSSDHKYFIVSGMLSFLETKYSDEEMEKIKIGMQLIVEKYNVYNSFVG